MVPILNSNMIVLMVYLDVMFDEYKAVYKFVEICIGFITLTSRKGGYFLQVSTETDRIKVRLAELIITCTVVNI